MYLFCHAICTTKKRTKLCSKDKGETKTGEKTKAHESKQHKVQLKSDPETLRAQYLLTYATMVEVGEAEI